MIVVFVLLAFAVVVGIGLIAVGQVTSRLAQEPPLSVFDMEEAVPYVADRLPDDVTAQLSYDDVRAILSWHIDYLEAKGVAGENDDALEHLPDGPIVTGDDEGVAYVLGKAGEASLDVDDVQIVQVLQAETAYLEAIGAIGPRLPDPVDPGGSPDNEA